MNSTTLTTTARSHAEMNAHLPLVWKVARQVARRLPSSVDVAELVGAGTIGLMDAMDRYEVQRCDRFSAYAEIRIRGAMVDELRSLDWVPRSVRQKGSNIDTVQRELQGRLGRPATPVEVATEMGLSLEEYHLLADKARAVSVVSYEDLGAGAAEEKRDFLDGIADPEAMSPEDTSEQTSEHDLMMQAIQELPERHRVVLTLYYFEDMNLKEIGTLLGVTESRISQIHSSAVAQLRPILEALMED